MRSLQRHILETQQPRTCHPHSQQGRHDRHPFQQGLAALAALGAFTQMTSGPTSMSWLIVSLACWLGAAVTFASAWFRRWTTEIDVTDRRIVYKRGLINRHAVEMNMDKVATVDVDQSVFGRLLNYGDITIRGIGSTIEQLRGIDAPLDFRNHVTAR